MTPAPPLPAIASEKLREGAGGGEEIGGMELLQVECRK
jgi:hypothetical protein